MPHFLVYSTRKRVKNNNEKENKTNSEEQSSYPISRKLYNDDDDDDADNIASHTYPLYSSAVFPVLMIILSRLSSFDALYTQ